MTSQAQDRSMPTEASPETAEMSLERIRSALHSFQSSGRAFQLLLGHRPSSKCRTLIILDSSFNPPTTAHMRMALTAIKDLQRKRGARTRDMRLLLLLAVNNADKKGPVKPAPFEYRLLLMQAFARDIRRQCEREQVQETKEEVGGLGIDVGLTSHPYFHDKSAAIASSGCYDEQGTDASQEPQCEQIVLAGYDTLIRIFNPKYYEAPLEGGADGRTPIQSALDPFFARARLRITMRTDADWGNKAEQLAYVDGLLHGDELDKVGGRRNWAERVELVEGRREEEGEEVVSSTLAREAAGRKDWEGLKSLVPEEVAKVVESDELYDA